MLWETEVLRHKCTARLMYRGVQLKQLDMNVWRDFPRTSAVKAMAVCSWWVLTHPRLLVRKMKAVDVGKEAGYEF